LLFIFIVNSINSFAQIDREFWFAVPDVDAVNHPVFQEYDRPVYLRLTTFLSPATITLSIPANPSFIPISATIPAASTSTIDMTAWIDLIENFEPNKVNNKGILIQSTADITAYYEVNSQTCQCNPELFALKGKNALGNNFFIPSQKTWAIDTIRHPNARAAFEIVATENSTSVTITPSQPLFGRTAGTPFTITLNRGQTFSLQALYRNAPNLLNGSTVSSNKPIAVTTKEDLLFGDGPCADLSGDQLIPVSIFGNEFGVVRGDLTQRDKVVIMASQNTTKIFFDGNATPAATINAGQSYETDITSMASLYIKSDKPVGVLHYTGSGCELGSAVIPKLNCTGSSSVSVVRSNSGKGTVLLITKNGNQGNFLVNGSAGIITASDFLPMTGTGGNYVFCKKDVTSAMGLNTATSFSNTSGKFQLGFINGDPGGYMYGYFSDFKKSNVNSSQVETCKSDSVQLNAFGGITYQWSPAIGLSNASISNPKASPTATTDYKVIITDADGCIDSAFVKVIINNCATLACNNWLSTPSNPSSVSMGQVNITGDKITVEANFNRTTPYSGGALFAGDLVSKHKDPIDVNYLLRPNHAEITTTNGYFRTPDICEIELNKTYHVSLVYDGTTLKFYRNGFLMSQIAASGNLIQNNWETRVAYYESQLFNTNFIGYINEVRIWNVARTQAQIKANMNSSLPNPTTQTGLVAYYTFNNLLNKQGNAAFNGTLNGGATINATNPNCSFTPDTCLVTSCTSKEDFSIKRNACTPNSLELETSAAAGTYTDIKWDLGDGTIKTGVSKLLYNYPSLGNYTVTMILLKPTCNDTIIKTITLDVQQENVILTNDTTICYGASKKLRTIPAATSFCWTPTTYLDNPSIQEPTSSTPRTITYYYTAERTGANLIINGDFSAGATGFSSDYTLVNPNLTEGEYYVDSSPQAWNNSLSNCGDHTNVSGNMLLVNGSPVSDLNVWTQTVPVMPNTNYSFSTWVQALWSPNPALLKFSINGNDLGATITASLPTCTWTQFYTTWNSGNNTLATISIVNKNTAIQGNDFALDDISFAPTYMKRDSVKITVDSPNVKTIENSLICTNKSVQLNTIGAVNYSWTPSTGLSNPTISNPIASPSVTTTYIVTGANANGCTAKDTVTVALKPPANFAINPAIGACNNTPVQLNAGGGDTYLWSPAALLNNPAIKNPVANISSNTTFTVTITDTVCQTSIDLTTAVSVLPSPNVQITEPQDIDCNTPAAQLIASGAQRYNWFPSIGLNNSNISNPIVSIDTSTTYIVKGTDNNGCIAYDTVTVKVTRNGSLVFDMANAFTPNNDGHNDCFGLGRFAGLVQSLQLSVYNRWGQRVFYTTNPNTCWDGTLKGKLQDSGGYIYLLKAKTFCGNFNKKGIVMLLR
jgi:gliding motility-associated-like protein